MWVEHGLWALHTLIFNSNLGWGGIVSNKNKDLHPAHCKALKTFGNAGKQQQEVMSTTVYNSTVHVRCTAKHLRNSSVNCEGSPDQPAWDKMTGNSLRKVLDFPNVPLFHLQYELL